MKAKADQILRDSIISNRIVIYLSIAGFIAIVTSLGWNMHAARVSIVDETKIRARSAYEKDVVYRRWNAGHGGVYVTPTEQTPPNPYLEFIPERDLITQEGKKLTLVNPAYMTRQVFEIGDAVYGFRSHITSLRPVRPENKADQWEVEALKSFEMGEDEISSIELLDGEEYLRLMKPLVTEKSCLKCHEKQGYKEGDIRGGISISVPMEPQWAALREQEKTLLLGHFWILIVLGAGLYAVSVTLKNTGVKRIKILKELQESNYFLEESQRITELGSYAFDITAGFWTSSAMLDEIFGIDNDYSRDLQGWVSIVHPDDQKKMLDYYNQNVLVQHEPFDMEYRIIRINDQSERWVHGLGELSYDDEGNAVKMIGTIRDVTDSHENAMQMKKTINRLNKLNKNMVGRELKMIEMKKEIDELCTKAGLPPRYHIPADKK